MNQRINGKKEGYWENLYSKGNYKNDKRDGYWEVYHQNGNLFYKGNYVNGIEDGYWEYYKCGKNVTSEYIKYGDSAISKAEWRDKQINSILED